MNPKTGSKLRLPDDMRYWRRIGSNETVSDVPREAARIFEAYSIYMTEPDVSLLGLVLSQQARCCIAMVNWKMCLRTPIWPSADVPWA